MTQKYSDRTYKYGESKLEFYSKKLGFADYSQLQHGCERFKRVDALCTVMAGDEKEPYTEIAPRIQLSEYSAVRSSALENVVDSVAFLASLATASYCVFQMVSEGDLRPSPFFGSIGGAFILAEILVGRAYDKYLGNYKSVRRGA